MRKRDNGETGNGETGNRANGKPGKWEYGETVNGKTGKRGNAARKEWLAGARRGRAGASGGAPTKGSPNFGFPECFDFGAFRRVSARPGNESGMQISAKSRNAIFGNFGKLTCAFPERTRRLAAAKMASPGAISKKGPPNFGSRSHFRGRGEGVARQRKVKKGRYILRQIDQPARGRESDS